MIERELDEVDEIATHRAAVNIGGRVDKSQRKVEYAGHKGSREGRRPGEDGLLLVVLWQDNCPKNVVKYSNQILRKAGVVAAGDPGSACRKLILLARRGCLCGIVDSEREGELGQIRFRIFSMPSSESLFCHVFISQYLVVLISIQHSA